MFHCYLTYYRYLKRPNRTEGIAEQFHIEEPDEKTIRKLACALSGLLQQMDIEHDVNFVYIPDRRSRRMKITQCEGNGQGECKRCADNGIWNRHWMTFLYHIEGMKGCYCLECVHAIEYEKVYGEGTDEEGAEE